MNRGHLLFAGVVTALGAASSACVTLLGDFSETSSATPSDDAGGATDGGARDVAASDAPSVPDAPNDAPNDANAADFVLSAAAPVAHVPRGAGASIELTIAPQGGFAADVVVTVSGLPVGVTVDPLTIAAGSAKGSLKFHAAAAVKLGTSAALTVTGSAPPLSHPIPLGLLVQDASGALDVTFNGTGIVAGGLVTSIGPNAIALQSDGKIVVCATTHRLQLPSTMLVTRITNDGTLDPTFGQSGVVTVASPFAGATASCNALALRANGNIVVAGDAADANQSTHFFVADLKTDGSFDTAFGGTGYATVNVFSGSAASTVNAVAILPLGKVLLAGSFGTTGLAFARFNLDGTPDTKLDTLGNGWSTATFPNATGFNGLAVVPNGNGSVLASLASTSIDVQRYNGALLDGTFFSSGTAQQNAGSGASTAKSMTLEPNGRIVVAGQALTAGTSPAPEVVVARFAADGHADAQFGAGGSTALTLGAASSYGNGVTIAPDGTIVVAGHIETATSSAYGVARFTPDGKLDTQFAGQGFVSTELGKGSEAVAVAAQPDGRIVVAGSQFHPSLGSAPYSTLVVARYWP